MSSNDDSGPGLREVAYRLFAAEFDDADFSYSESDEERAPNYVVTPTGARVNRMFLVGVLTEIETVGEDMLRARVVDPTGAFVVYAGQYQPDALAFLERVEPPTFLAVTGKARTFQPDDADVVYTSVRPETISEVDAETRDRWVVSTAEQTVERIARMARAKELGLAGEELEDALVESGVDPTRAEGIALALEHYDTSARYLSELRALSIEAAELVAGERDEVSAFSVDPDAPGEADLDALTRTPGEPAAIETEPVTETEAAAEATTEPLAEPATAGETGGEEAAGAASASSEGHPTARSEAETESETEVESEPAPETEPEPEAESLGEFDAESEIGEFDAESEPEEFELDEEVREEIESEYGTEFSTGTEVGEPGEAGIETPEVEAETEPEPEAETEPEPEAETEPETEPEPEAREVDLEEAVMDVMETLNEGDGVDRGALVSAVSDEYGADADAVEDAIQGALMSGRCYEPSEDTLKPI